MCLFYFPISTLGRAYDSRSGPGMDETPGQAGDDVWYWHDDAIFRCKNS